MLLRRRDDDVPNPLKLTVAQAAELACHEPPSFEGDDAGRAAARMAQTAALLGRLVQALHDEGTLDDAAVLQVVGDAFRDAADVQVGAAEGAAPGEG